MQTRSHGLSPQQANEAALEPLTAGRIRPVPQRPHLAAERDGALEAGGGAAAGLSLEPWHRYESIQRFEADLDARAPAYFAAKRALDIAGSVLLAVIFAPLMLAILLVLSSEGGPVIYRHWRVGRGGRAFECLKFRTMVPDADRLLRRLLEQDSRLKGEWVRDHKLRCDPRVTRLGRFLRRTSLDELPQLWNVMMGEMSLVGPRPVVRQELLRYGRNIPAYLSAKPGITGLWQIKGRNDTDYRRRVVLDAYYVRRQSLLLDLYILLKTTRVVLGGRGAY